MLKNVNKQLTYEDGTGRHRQHFWRFSYEKCTLFISFTKMAVSSLIIGHFYPGFAQIRKRYGRNESMEEKRGAGDKYGIIRKVQMIWSVFDLRQVRVSTDNIEGRRISLARWGQYYREFSKLILSLDIYEMKNIYWYTDMSK